MMDGLLYVGIGVLLALTVVAALKCSEVRKRAAKAPRE